jgi:hypothetical protein
MRLATDTVASPLCPPRFRAWQLLFARRLPEDDPISGFMALKADLQQGSSTHLDTSG